MKHIVGFSGGIDDVVRENLARWIGECFYPRAVAGQIGGGK